MSSTRPIPIGSGNGRNGSQRGTPPHSSSSSSAAAMNYESKAASPGISQSCPVDVHHPRLLPSTFHPPRAPFFGSLPEPSFMQLDSPPMPELVLPPPVQRQEESPPMASVVQFASSCPGDIGYLRQGNPVHSSWGPSPRASDEFDLSKSPALAVMSALRDGRPPSAFRASTGQARSFSSSARLRSSSQSRQYHSEYPSSYTVSAELMENLTITSEEEEPLDNEEQDSAPPQYQPHNLPPYNSNRRERRGSYDSGVFDFEDH